MFDSIPLEAGLFVLAAAAATGAPAQAVHKCTRGGTVVCQDAP